MLNKTGFKLSLVTESRISNIFANFSTKEYQYLSKTEQRNSKQNLLKAKLLDSKLNLGWFDSNLIFRLKTKKLNYNIDLFQ